MQGRINLGTLRHFATSQMKYENITLLDIYSYLIWNINSNEKFKRNSNITAMPHFICKSIFLKAVNR